MAEKQPKKEEEGKIDWHRFEYSEIGNDPEDADTDPETREKRKELKKLEMLLRKPWCCK